MNMKINQKLLIDSAISGVSVQIIPDIANKFLGLDLSSDITKNAVGGAGTFLLGMLLKNATIQNIGLGIAVSQIASTILKDLLFDSTPTTPTQPVIKTPTTTGITTVKQPITEIAGYLNDYVQSATVPDFDIYKQSYLLN